MSKTNPSFLNGVPELLVLKLLSRREMYGYEIVRAIQVETKTAFSFGEGCIYPYLHYLEKENYMQENPVKAGLVAKPEDWPWRGHVHDLSAHIRSFGKPPTKSESASKECPQSE